MLQADSSVKVMKKQSESRALLGRADVDGAFQLLFAVVLEIHELGLAQDEPAHLPVAPGQRGHASSFLVEPARLKRLLFGPEPHEGLVL